MAPHPDDLNCTRCRCSSCNQRLPSLDIYLDGRMLTIMRHVVLANDNDYTRQDLVELCHRLGIDPARQPWEEEEGPSPGELDPIDDMYSRDINRNQPSCPTSPSPTPSSPYPPLSPPAPSPRSAYKRDQKEIRYFDLHGYVTDMGTQPEI